MSIQSRNRNLGIQNARKSAKSIVRIGSKRPAPRATDALFGDASHSWTSMRDALRHWLATATCVLRTYVTGGACCAVALQRSERRDLMGRGAGHGARA